jgi:glutamate N-acetyltransferase/amino-acid N-acetyltransferase
MKSPKGFMSWVANVGLAEAARDDFTIVTSTVPCTSVAVFTRSLFAGPCVELSREAVKTVPTRGVVVLAKNANVATGERGLQNASEVRQLSALVSGVEPEELIISSTGVIGVQYPMDEVRHGIKAITSQGTPLDGAAVARAIMTTDTRPKVATRRVGEATILGVAKGVGMIEPNMATMLSYVFTDAAVEQSELERIFRRVVELTYNSVSIDTDTSTSDTAVILANGLAGTVELNDFEQALLEVCTDLVIKIARDGEGASKLIRVNVTSAASEGDARKVAKEVVNSPLVKTMVHGADPNWGRILMAIGKCDRTVNIDPQRVSVTFGQQRVYPVSGGQLDAVRLREHLMGTDVHIGIDLAVGKSKWTVYGCDLTEGYIRINADYTT